MCILFPNELIYGELGYDWYCMISSFEFLHEYKGPGQNPPSDKTPLRPKPPSGQNPPPAKTPL